MVEVGLDADADVVAGAEVGDEGEADAGPTARVWPGGGVAGVSVTGEVPSGIVLGDTLLCEDPIARLNLKE